MHQLVKGYSEGLAKMLQNNWKKKKTHDENKFQKTYVLHSKRWQIAALKSCTIILQP